MTAKQLKYYRALIYSELSIMDIANRYNIKKGTNGLYKCPNTGAHNHGDANPSMGINEEKGIFNCLACGASGKHDKLVMYALNLNETEAVERIINDFNINVDRDTPTAKKAPKKHFRAQKRETVEEPKQEEPIKQTEKLFVRSLHKDAEKKSYYVTAESVTLRDPVASDEMYILNNINKNYTAKGLITANVKMCDSPKALVFPKLNARGGYLLMCETKVTNDYIIVEGRTDYASAVCIGLHKEYNIFMRSNKTSKYELPNTFEKLVYILDPDDDAKQAIKRLHNKIHAKHRVKAMKFTDIINEVNLSMYNFKDLSDYHASNMGINMLINLINDTDYMLIKDNAIDDVSQYHFFELDKNDEVKIDTYYLYKTLEKFGFAFLVDVEVDNNRRLGRLHNNTIEYFTESETHTWVLNDLVEEYPEQINDNISREELQRALFYIPTAFETKKFNIMKRKEIHPHRDRHDAGYVYLNDYYIEVTKDKIERLEYKNLHNPIFKNTIKNKVEFDIYPYLPKRNALDIITDKYSQNCVFDLFLQRVSTNYKGGELDFERYEALKCVIGYLLHRYKDPNLTKAVIFSENNITNEPHGRTGKGLILQMISKLMNVCAIDGKNLNMNNQFSFSHLDKWTDILAFNDVAPSLSFERLFALIADEFTYQKKGKDIITMPYEVSPKFYFSTNRPVVRKSGGSFEARMYEMELYCYFSSDYTPKHEFGHMFYYDWDKTEMNKFYSFLLHCLQLFLTKSLVYYKSDTLMEKKVTADVSLDGYVYLNKIIREQFERFPDKKEILINKNDLLLTIQELAENDRITKKRVTQGLGNYAKMLNYNFEPTCKYNEKYHYRISRKPVPSDEQIII